MTVIGPAVDLITIPLAVTALPRIWIPAASEREKVPPTAEFPRFASTVSEMLALPMPPVLSCSAVDLRFKFMLLVPVVTDMSPLVMNVPTA